MVKYVLVLASLSFLRVKSSGQVVSDNSITIIEDDSKIVKVENSTKRIPTGST